MWIYKEHDILPNQWHHFYDQGDTILYLEHIQDLLTIDKMWNNKLIRERKKAEAAQRAKEKNPFGKGAGFYGQTHKYK
jgi:hypothetical protein